jgi:hypothetical protein
MDFCTKPPNFGVEAHMEAPTGDALKMERKIDQSDQAASLLPALKRINKINKKNTGIHEPENLKIQHTPTEMEEKKDPTSSDVDLRIGLHGWPPAQPHVLRRSSAGGCTLAP